MTRPDTTYRRDAEAWRSDPANPDGWLQDPEVDLAWWEHTQTMTDTEALEWLRGLWRGAAARWRDGSGPEGLRLAAAAEMVVIEGLAARVPNRCSPGQHCDLANLDLCSKHSWQYQSRYGRAYNE